MRDKWLIPLQELTMSFLLIFKGFNKSAIATEAAG